MGLNTEQLAGKLHLQLVQETARLQQDLLQMRALQKEFGDNALWVGRGGLLTFRNSLKLSAKNLLHWIEQTTLTIQEHLDAIRQLEEAFERQEEIDLKEIVDFVRQRHGMDKEVVKGGTDKG